MTELIYHAAQPSVSPFDEAILRVARTGPVRIVSPYVGVAYLERIIGICPEWRLLSDVQEWLGALTVQARPRAWQFIRNNLDRIHHCPALHAKAVISDSLAMLGSANLTQYGILGRTELGILLDDPTLVREMASWFERIWTETAPPVADEASAYIQWLDAEAAQAPARRQRVAISSESRKVRARLVELEPVKATERESVPLELSRVAQSMISEAQKYFASAELALEAAINKLLKTGDFTFDSLVEATREGFSQASRREIYLLLLQRVANHPRSVFASATQSRLILSADGRFSQSTQEVLWPALVPFENFLVSLIELLGFDQASVLPSEEQFELETGFTGRIQVILLAELIECGFLLLEDRPGALARYQLDQEFGWEDRFKLFPSAKSAWTVKLYQSRNDAPAPACEDEDPDLVEKPVGYVVLRLDQLPEAAEDDDLDLASLERELTRGVAVKSPRQELDPEACKQARQNARALEKVTVDLLLSKVLRMYIAGQTFRAPSREAVFRRIAIQARTTEFLAKAALTGLRGHPRVLKVNSLSNGEFELKIHPKHKLELLQQYPETRAAFKELLNRG